MWGDNFTGNQLRPRMKENANWYSGQDCDNLPHCHCALLSISLQQWKCLSLPAAVLSLLLFFVIFFHLPASLSCPRPRLESHTVRNVQLKTICDGILLRGVAIARTPQSHCHTVRTKSVLYCAKKKDSSVTNWGCHCSADCIVEFSGDRSLRIFWMENSGVTNVAVAKPANPTSGFSHK